MTTSWLIVWGIISVLVFFSGMAAMYGYTEWRYRRRLAALKRRANADGYKP